MTTDRIYSTYYVCVWLQWRIQVGCLECLATYTTLGSKDDHVIGTTA